jgi:hypothetical protein
VTAADDSARINRVRQLEEHRKLADVLGVQIPVMPPRLTGESDKDYGCRIAWIAKSHCGPPPRPKQPPKRPPKVEAGKAEKADKATYQPPDPDAERLSGMTADFTSEDEP